MKRGAMIGPVQLGRAAAISVVLVTAGCADGAPAASAGRIRVGYSGRADFADLPSLVAHDRLRARGYEVSVTEFSAPDLAIDALARGSVDLAHGTMSGAWRAAARGAPVRTVMEQVRNPYRFVAVREVADCRGLDGRTLALADEGAVSTHLVRAFLAEECPDARPAHLSLTESMNRAAALLAGGLAAAALEVDALLWLESQEPGRFHLLSDFSDRWPLVMTTGVHVNTRFADDSDAAVRAYLQALLDANREMTSDPALVASEAGARFGPSAQWPAAGRAYVRASAWPVDVQLSGDAVQTTLTFFEAHGLLPPGLEPAAVVDVRFLHALASGETR